MHSKTGINSNPFLMNSHLGAGAHQPAIHCGPWKGDRNVWTLLDLWTNCATLHKACTQFNCVHTSQSQLANINLKTQNVFPQCQRKHRNSEPCKNNMLHAGVKRNKRLHGFVIMISLSAQGNYVTMAMYFLWVKLRNSEAGRSCMFGVVTYWGGETDAYPVILWLHSSHI